MSKQLVAKKTIAFYICFAIIVLFLFKSTIWYITNNFSIKHYYTKEPSYSYQKYKNISPAEVRVILSQPFTYINQGRESTTFASQDDEWVLKIVRQNRFTPFHISRFSPPFVTKIMEVIKTKKEGKREKLYASCHIAIEILPIETALYCLSINSEAQTVELRDKLNRCFTIDLSHCAFSLQKKASLLYPTLTNYMKQGKEQEAKESLRSLICLLQSRLNKGISDDDPSLKKNVGFIGTKALFLDIGGFKESMQCKKKEQQQHDILIALRELEEWLQEHYPNLKEYLKELTSLSL